LRTDFTVDPGDTQVERHQSLLVLVRFQKSPPRDVYLDWQPAEGAPQRITMTKSLDDPVFAGRLASISHHGTYRLEFDGDTTQENAVAVYDLPVLVHSTVEVIAPSYTHRERQVFESAAAVTTIEGSEVRLECRVNKPLARVELRNDKDAAVISLT